MTTEQQEEFIEALEGDLSPQQAAQLLELGEGDSGDTSPRTEDEPDPSAKTGEGATGKPESGSAGSTDGGKPAEKDTKAVDESQLNADNAEILAKDGKHTISYDKLVEARQGKQQAEQQLIEKEAKLAETQARLDQLLEEAKAREAAGDGATKVDTQAAAAKAAIDSGANPEIFGDFSEEALAKGISTLVAMQVEARVKAVMQEVDAKLTPLQRTQQKNALDSHYEAIYEKHPDADSIAESKELDDWINAQPSFVRDGCRAVLESGTTQQVIELFTTFKASREAQPGDTDPQAGDVKAKAKAALEGATQSVPASLSDFPGGKPGAGASREEALANMDATDMLEAMENMTPEQIDAFLNKSL